MKTSPDRFDVIGNEFDIVEDSLGDYVKWEDHAAEMELQKIGATSFVTAANMKIVDLEKKLSVAVEAINAIWPFLEEDEGLCTTAIYSEAINKVREAKEQIERAG